FLVHQFALVYVKEIFFDRPIIHGLSDDSYSIGVNISGTSIKLRSNHFVSILVHITVKVSVIVARIFYANTSIAVYKGIYLIVNGEPFNFPKLVIHPDSSTVFSHPYPAFGGTDRGLIGKGKHD